MVKGDGGWWPSGEDHLWIASIGRPPHPILVEMESLALPEGVPILGRDSGRVLGVLASGRRRVVEVGTAIGYSTLWIARSLAPDGTIVTIDPDRSRTSRARQFWRRAGIADERISVVSAPALEALADGHPELAGPFDLAFIDALKHEYPAYLAALRPRLAPGALVVADNVLWSGRTSGSRASDGPDTEALRRFCEEVLGDPAFRATILPVGDGLLVAVLAEDAA